MCCSIQGTCYVFLPPQVIPSLLGSREALANLIWNQMQEKNSSMCRRAVETVFCMQLSWRTLLLLLKIPDAGLLCEAASPWERHSPKFYWSTIGAKEINFSSSSLVESSPFCEPQVISARGG